MRKLLLLLFILSLPAYAIETKNDPLSEFSEETLSTHNDKTNSIIGDLEDLEDDIESNDTDIATNETDIATVNALISTSGTSVASSLLVTDASGYLPDNSVDTTALKTTTGAVSSTSEVGENDTLPGGEYGFYPQIKMSDTTSGQWQSTIVGNKYNQMSFAGWTTYATKITLSSLNGKTMYAQQRYITASGTDQWIFLKLDKITKEILSGWQAPDHPSYGNGGDAEKLPHPFGSYDETKHEIILLNKETCKQLQEKATRERDILTLVHEEYKPDMAEKETYQPLHSGKFLEQKPVLIETIPDYISVRKLIKRSK